MNKSMLTGITLGVATVAVGVVVAFNFMGGGSDSVYSPSVFGDQQYKMEQQDQTTGYKADRKEYGSIYKTTEVANRQLRDYENTYVGDSENQPTSEQAGSGKRSVQSSSEEGARSSNVGSTSDIAVGTEAEIQKHLTELEKQTAEAKKINRGGSAEKKEEGLISKLKSTMSNIFGGGKGTTKTSSSGQVYSPVSPGTTEYPTQAGADIGYKELGALPKGTDTKRGRVGSFSQQGSSSTTGGINKNESLGTQSDYQGTTDLKMVSELSKGAAAKDERELSSSAGLDPFMGVGEREAASVNGNLNYESADQVLESLDEDLYAGVEETLEDLETREEQINAERERHKRNAIALTIAISAALVGFWALMKFEGIELNPYGWAIIAGIMLTIFTLIAFLTKEAAELARYSGEGAQMYILAAGLFSLLNTLIPIDYVSNFIQLPSWAQPVIQWFASISTGLGSILGSSSSKDEE
ncbi:MAG: hypothetical protein HOF38_00595 [Elusimicrobiaceae bacterium]|nr:hypothetical protein [Elusimicrobiaceae bacterium]MBT4440240.1 hypothetical protein [Elusimicrobiaceae bacterium]MBT5987204.1 hypothetical protein [Elusimicrobiaceae bacterium]